MANDQVVANTWFQEHPQHLWTRGKTKKQIDYITINEIQECSFTL